MTEAWTPLCLIAACDLGQAEWPLPLVILDEGLGLAQDGVPQNLTEVFPRLALAVSRSAKGAALLDRLEARLAETGQSLDGLRHDLSPNQDLQAALAAGLATALARSQRRVAAQARELSQMRQMTERSLQNFARLEAFVWQTVKAERQLVTSLPVRLDLPALPLAAVEQRLPGGSTGLSDVAICLADPGPGLLTATLVLLESTEVVGRWQIRDPQMGWLRLALPRALGSDGQTPILRLDWEGAPAELCLSHPHPDPRYRCQGGPMLALRIWRHVAGTVAPLAPGSVAAEGAGPVRRWLLGTQALTEALGAPTLSATAGQETEVALPGPAPAGTRHIQARLQVEGSAEVGLASGAAAQWHWITGHDQLHLFLPEPLARPQDLVLRLRGGDRGARIAIEALEFLGDERA